MRLLVIGGTRFVGRHLVDAALARGDAVTLFNRTTAGIAVIHDRNPLFVTLQNGSIRNGYTARLINKELQPRHYAISVEGIDGAWVEAVGVPPDLNGHPIVAVRPDTTQEVRLLVHTPAGSDLAESTPITFRIRDVKTGEEDTVSDNFKAPAK